MKATTILLIASTALSAFATPALADWGDIAKIVQRGNASQIGGAISGQLGAWRDGPSAPAEFSPAPYIDMLPDLLRNCPAEGAECVSTIVDTFKAYGIRLNPQSMQAITAELGLSYSPYEIELLSFPWEWGAKNEITRLAKEGSAERLSGYVRSQLSSLTGADEGWKNTILLEAMKQCDTTTCFEAIARSAEQIGSTFTLKELQEAAQGAQLAFDDATLGQYVVPAGTFILRDLAENGDIDQLAVATSERFSGLGITGKKNLLEAALRRCRTTSCFTSLTSVGGTLGVQFSNPEIEQLAFDANLTFSQEELALLGIGAVSPSTVNVPARTSTNLPELIRVTRERRGAEDSLSGTSDDSSTGTSVSPS